MKPFTKLGAALLTAVLAFPLAALAQNPAAGGSQPSGPSASARQTATDQAGGRREAQVERRITDLHAKLHITQAQEPAWSQFVEVMRGNARNMDQSYEQRAERVAQMSAVDNIRSYAQVAEAHAQDVQRLVPAFQSLYDSMSADQKRTADQLFRNYAERSERRAGGHRG